MTKKYMDMGRVEQHYAGVDHTQGVAIYTRADMYDAAFDLGKFRELPRDTKSLFVDLMSGVKCLVASEIRKRAGQGDIPLDIYCLDIVFSGMSGDDRTKLQDQFHLTTADITEGIPYQSGEFHRAAARFGIKNYQPDVQTGILTETRRILIPGGYFVLADMVAPEASYQWAQTERHRKSKHTVGEENASHHIPTLGMWFDMLQQTGFEPTRDDIYETKSYVTTTNWVTSKQMSEDAMDDMNKFLLSAPDQARRDYNIREDEVDGKKVVRIDYPVVVIAARAV